MSPFRIVLSFAVAAYAVYQGIKYPGQQWWYGVAAVTFLLGVYRIIKYRKTGSQTGSGTQDQL